MDRTHTVIVSMACHLQIKVHHTMSNLIVATGHEPISTWSLLKSLANPPSDLDTKKEKTYASMLILLQIRWIFFFFFCLKAANILLGKEKKYKEKPFFLHARYVSASNIKHIVLNLNYYMQNFARSKVEIEIPKVKSWRI